VNRRKGETMKVYEAPMLVELGSFRELTGLLSRHGNDRLIFSKNS
jgi:Family of unknown function (DUF5972)